MIKINKLKEGFGTNKINSLIPKIFNVLEKRIGKAIFYSKAPINFSNSEGFHSGAYALVEGDKAIRLNWKIGAEHSAIESVDVWLSEKDVPDWNIDVTGLNIIQIMDVIEDALNGIVNNINESTIISVKEKDMPNNVPVKRGRGRPRKGEYSKVLMDPKDKERILKSFKIPTSEKFKQIFSFIDVVMKGTFKGLIVGGRPGVGKSTQILTLLKNKNINFVHLSGGVRNVKELYRFLFAYRNEDCIVLDDFDAPLKDKKAQDLLKAALDISPSKENVISYLDPKFLDPQQYVKLSKNKKLDPFKYVSNSFIFRSRLIIITNLNIKLINSAVLSRVLSVDMDISNEEIINSIQANIDKFPPFEVERKYKVAALNFLKPYIEDITNFDFRDYEKCVALASTDAPNWKSWAMNQILASR